MTDFTDDMHGEPTKLVPLDRYATVLVMRQEGIPLDEAIARADVPPRAWAKAESAWEARIARAEEELIGELDAAFAAAQDRLARPIPPIDRDLAAWLDFLRHWSADPSPMALLERLGLRVQDVFRLQRTWGRRLKEDDALRQSMSRIIQQPLGPMPAIRPEVLVLGPLPPPTTDSTIPASVAAATLPPLSVPLPDASGADAPPPPVRGPTAPTLAPVPSFSAEVPSPHVARPVTPEYMPSAVAVSFVPEGMRHFTDLRGTQLAPLTDPVAPATPFQPVAGDRSLPASSAVPPTSAVASSLHVARPVTPEHASSTVAVSFVPEGMRHFTDLRGTQLAPLTDPPAPAMPFQPTAGDGSRSAPAPVPPVSAAAPSPLVSGPVAPKQGAAAGAASFIPEGMRHFTDLRGTQLAPPTDPPAPAMPFQPATGDRAGPLPRASVETEKAVPRPRSATAPIGGMTADISAVVRSILPTTPFGSGPGSATSAGSERAEPPRETPPSNEIQAPIGGAARPLAPAESPQRPPPEQSLMPLEQYASLCAELGVFPQSTERAFHRHGLLEMRDRLTADLKWRERFRRAPTEYAEWQRFYAHYQRYWSDQRQRGMK